MSWATYKDKRSRDSALGEYNVYSMGFPGGSVVKNPSTNAGDAADLCWIPGLGRSPGGGNGNPLQYSWLESPKWIEEPGRLQFMGAQSDMTEYMNEVYIPGFGARHPGQLAFTSFLILDIFLNLSVFLFFFFFSTAFWQ